MTLRRLLVIGATGKQGGAVIDALIASSAPFEILALTRNISSPSAQKLASKSNVTLVQGDSENAAPIFEAHTPIYGVFLVTSFKPGNNEMEEAQAYPVIDAAVKAGVEHLIFTSVDRGGDASEQTPTDIGHFASKHRIEKYLKEKTAGTKTQWTILRPVAFMDNLVPGLMGKMFPAMWGASLGNEKTLQLISVHDIGVFAAQAFQNPQEYKGRAISLAGDELTLPQAKEVFKKAVGYDMPATFQFLGSAVLFMVKEMGTMFKWFHDVGYGVEIQALKKEEPKLQDFETWLKESSDFVKHQ